METARLNPGHHRLQGRKNGYHDLETAQEGESDRVLQLGCYRNEVSKLI